jgi:hypothetical protein
MKNADLDSVEKAAKKLMQKSYQRKVTENVVSGFYECVQKFSAPIFLGNLFNSFF